MPKSTSAVFGQAELDFWNRNGYVVLPNAVPSSQLNDTVIAMERFFGQDFSQPADWYKHPLFPGVISPHSQIDTLLSNVDFTPTILDLVGISHPQAETAFHGQSFAALLRHEPYHQHRAIYAEHTTA